MKSIFSIFKLLQERPLAKGDSYNIEPLPSVKNHKIGISLTGRPVFFIKCKDVDGSKLLNCNLEFISVHFNCSCQLLSKSRQITDGTYTIISLNTDLVELQEYFLEVVYWSSKASLQIPNRKS